MPENTDNNQIRHYLLRQYGPFMFGKNFLEHIGDMTVKMDPLRS